MKLTEVSAGIGSPPARLAIQLTRRRRPLTRPQVRTETVYTITDLTWNPLRGD